MEKRPGEGLVGEVVVFVLFEKRGEGLVGEVVLFVFVLFEKRGDGFVGEVVVLVVAGLLPKSEVAGVVSAGFGTELLLAVFAPKRVAGCGAVALPKRLAVLLLALLAGVVVLLVAEVVSVVGLAPKRLVAGAVVAFVATGGLVVTGFALSAVFAG